MEQMVQGNKVTGLRLKVELKKRLKARGMTVAHLSRTTGISRRTLNDWLGGSPPRNIADVKKVAQVLGTTVDDLCFAEAISQSELESRTLFALTDEEGWLSGTFEIKLRKVK